MRCTFYYRGNCRKAGSLRRRRKKTPSDRRERTTLFSGGSSTGLLSGYWKAGCFTSWAPEVHYQNLVRDVGILAMGFLSLASPLETPRSQRVRLGPDHRGGEALCRDFMTILPALGILQAGHQGALADCSFTEEPAAYYWASGLCRPSWTMPHVPHLLLHGLGQVG